MTDKLSLFANIASDWWWEMDAELRFTFLSDRFFEIFGWPPSVALGKRRTELGRTDYDNPTWRVHLDDLENHRAFRNFETTFVDVHGVARPVMISGTPLFAPDGAFQGYVGVGHDLTELRRREQEASEHAANLESILGNIEQGVVLFDASLRIVTYNQRLADFLNVPESWNVRGETYETVVRRLADRGEYGPQGKEAAIAKRMQMVQSREPVVAERRRDDGRIVSVTFTPLPAGGGIMTYTDVTEARAHEEQLVESERSFRYLFDNSPLPKWVYNVDSLRFVEVNAAAIATYGYSREEFLAMTLFDIRPREDVDRLKENLRWRRESGEVLSVATGWRHRRKNGSILDVELHLRDIEFKGEPARLAVVIDVTARKLAERELQSLFETTQDVIFITDGYGRFLRVSPSVTAALGYRPEEMIGRSGADFMHADDLDGTRQEMRLARRGRASRNFKSRYVHKNGRVVPLTWMGVWSEPDRRHYFFGRDMSEYEHTEAQLRQSQKMEAVGQLTGGVAHDFNNILMVIMASTDAIDEEEGLDPRVRRRLERIGNATRRAVDLTRQLLAFSRKQPLRPQRTNVNDLIVETGKLLRRTIGEQIEIESVLADDLWNIDIDRAQLESAIVNLCINARDAMPGGGRLLFETTNTALDQDYVGQNPDAAVGDYVMIVVTDTGSGISGEVLGKVFEPFFTTKGPGKGTGLGLSMVYGFVKQSNGHIKIYSEVGRGTSIRLYLPRAGDGQAQAAAPTVQAFMPRGHERILVVEDDAQVRASVVEQLQSLGYAVTEAPDGSAGLTACELAASAFDLLLTDVIMPGSINGKMLADTVNARWPATKVVFMSGYTENAVVHHGRLDPGVLLLSKPFRKADLAQIIREALEAVDAGDER